MKRCERKVIGHVIYLLFSSYWISEHRLYHLRRYHRCLSGHMSEHWLYHFMPYHRCLHSESAASPLAGSSARDLSYQTTALSLGRLLNLCAGSSPPGAPEMLVP